jgi:histidinol-phosphate aminotransferase
MAREAIRTSVTRSSVIRPEIARLPTFGGVPTADSFGEGEQPLLLHLNECPYPPSPKVVEAIRRAAAGGNRYAEARPHALSERLAAMAGVEPERIVLGAGTDEILAMIAVMALGPGDAAVVPTPSFPRYRLSALMQGAEPVLAALKPDGSNDVMALLDAVDARTRVLYACTPNNPSGAPLAPDELERLAAGTPADVLLVVDEAYAEFNLFEGGVDALPALSRRQGPWISTRTFSKAYALAGLRIGYAIASDREIAEGLSKVKLNFNLNRLAVHAALAALDDIAHARELIGRAVAERNRVAGALEAMGLPPLPSRANFLSFDIRRAAGPVMRHMAERGVFVREWRDPGHESFIRITIGAPHENDRALAALREALAPMPAGPQP